MDSARKGIFAGLKLWDHKAPGAAPALPEPGSTSKTIEAAAVPERTGAEGDTMNEHIVKSYEDELALLDKKIAHMGGLAERILAQAFDALERRDPRLAEIVVRSDKSIDALEREIEEQVVSMIARRQPMADDLRHVMAALRITTDLERVGDLAKNIAKRALAIAHESHPKPLMSGLRHMGELALTQLKEVLDAYAERNADRALVVWREDEKVDAMYNSLFRELLTYMMEDPRNIGISTHLLFGAKNIERVGDHTTNIAETIHFLVRGVNITDDRPKGDETSTTLFQKD
jgi:phosphate transport system protein